MDKHTSDLKPPVVAVLGHVDHGKTTLLDYLRRSRIASGEAGGITQHIGAYQVDVADGKKVTFIDTPGHEAFINLRSRGANVADVALLVIDASESVKPQTIESIKIIQKAGIPMIIAMNKIDLPTANVKKVAQDLLRYNIQTEEHGGQIAAVPISAKSGKGIPDLLETILLVAEMQKIVPDSGKLTAAVIESKKDKFRGKTVALLVRSGILKTGEKVWVGDRAEKIRALFDDRGKAIKIATPGMPVEVLGFEKLPEIGSIVTGESQTITVAEKDVQQSGETVLSIMLKADAVGSLEALTAGLPSDLAVIQTGIGDITEGDITAAKASGLVIIGFHVGLSARVKKFAEDEGVRIRTYDIIYKLFEEIADVVEILKSGPQKEIIGEAKVVQEFDTSDGKVAGSQVTEGRIAKGDKIQIVRNNEIIAENLRVASVREHKDEVTKVEKGKMCGIILAGRVDFRIGDMIQSYTLYEL